MEPYVFELPFTVRDYELDFQGIVNNSVYLNYLEHTRHAFLKQAGVNLPELHREGIDPVLYHADIQYRHSLVSEDAFISKLYVRKEGIRYVFYQAIYRAKDNILIIKAKIEIVITLYRKPQRHSIFDELFEPFLT